MTGKPESAVILSSLGIGFQVLSWIIASLFIGYWFRGPYMGPFMGMMYPAYAFSWWPFYPAFGLFIIIIGAIAITLMNSAQKERVQVGAILMIIASVVAFPTMFGFMIGSLLMFIGGIFGLIWEPQVIKP